MLIEVGPGAGRCRGLLPVPGGLLSGQLFVPGGWWTRFATFNLENLFARPRVFKLEKWKDGEPILKAFAEFNSRIEKLSYTPANKARMKELLLELEVYRLDNGVVRRNRLPDPKWVWLRANRGTFDVEHKDTGIEIVANSRYDWTGWLELAKEPVDEVSTQPAPWLMRSRFRPSTPDPSPEPSKAAPQRTDWTPPFSPRTSSQKSWAEGSNDTACGEIRQTRSRRRPGISTPASRTPARPPPTTQPSSSTSTFETRNQAHSGPDFGPEQPLTVRAVPATPSTAGLAVIEAAPTTPD